MAPPIRSSQVTSPIPYNFQAECICVPKVYDFVVFTEDINVTVPLPATPPANCPTTVTDISCELTTEPIPITCATNGVCTVLDRRPINIDEVNAALVKFRQDIPIDVTLTGTDATGATATCTIVLLVPFIRQVVLCFPSEFTNDNLICRIISGDCRVTTPPPVGGIPFPSSVVLELFVCEEIQVLAAVKLEVLAKFCSPRKPVEIPVTSVCPTITFPDQCTFFPQPICTNQACQIVNLQQCNPISQPCPSGPFTYFTNPTNFRIDGSFTLISTSTHCVMNVVYIAGGVVQFTVVLTSGRSETIFFNDLNTITIECLAGATTEPNCTGNLLLDLHYCVKCNAP